METMAEDVGEIVVLMFTPMSGETEAYAFTDGAAANRAAATLLIDRIDEWHSLTPGERLVEQFLNGDYRGMVNGWSDVHEEHEGWGRLEFFHVTLDSAPRELAAMREKAEQWQRRDEQS
jgi:hypothetical protein